MVLLYPPWNYNKISFVVFFRNMKSEAKKLKDFLDLEPEDEVEDLETILIDKEENDGEKSAILLDPVAVRVVELDLTLAYGTFSYYNEKEGYWEADFTMTVIYKGDATDPADYLFWEQDPPEIALWNYLRATERLDMERFKDLDDLLELEAERVVFKAPES